MRGGSQRVTVRKSEWLLLAIQEEQLMKSWGVRRKK